MKTLSEIKDEIAQLHEYDGWNQVLGCEDWVLYDEVAELYADQYRERLAEIKKENQKLNIILLSKEEELDAYKGEIEELKSEIVVLKSQRQ
jgi:CRISPR/Cas system CMR subunit Cmr4 (Cas7 group RAMP superfamily)